jgi:predicted unusual protein kinase regulating ubiquinone biosynthesis (AarF/ABC1/UbiB family)
MRLFYRMLGTYLYHEKVLARFAPDPEAKEARRLAMWTRLGALYRSTALSQGGLFIKAGQILSARSDIFPRAFTLQLASLQDEVPGVAFDEIRGVIEKEFGRPISEIFPTIDPVPLAAASLGQVHRATLPDGQPVVVKVLRPGVDQLIRADLEGFRQVTRFLIRWTRWAKGLDMAGIYYESVNILLRELDLRDEARHTERFARMFNDDPRVMVPHVYQDYTRQRVLTLSFVQGHKLTDHAALEAAGIPPTELARQLIHALSRQVLAEGFFHADPHPGNLMAMPGPTLVMLDFGMVGQLTPRHRSAFKRIALGLLQKDPDVMLQGLDELEMLRPTADRLALRRALAWLFEKNLQGNLFDLRPQDFLEVAREIREIFASQAFQFPSDIAFLGRGASITFGVCRTLDPKGDFIKEVESAVRAHLDVGQEASQTLTEMAAGLAKLPARLDRVLTVIERGQKPGTAVSGDRPRFTTRPAAWATLALGFLGGNQWWPTAPKVAIACWAIAGLAALWLVWRSLPPAPMEP